MNAQRQSSWKDAWNFDSLKPDYQAWKIRIRSLLEAENVWDIVSGQLRFQDWWHARHKDDFVRRDKRALLLLISSLDNATVKAVGKYDRSWLVYEHLERVYAGTRNVSIARARKEFISLRYEDGSDMQGHINELEDKAEVLSILQRPIADDEKCLEMLDSLPSSWSNLVTVFRIKKICPGNRYNQIFFSSMITERPPGIL
ncbi:hypothetical protein PI125_g15404 [Phytophthora idaei]|nr:hypothetical protein PI125_g15404 [Phytophthora idaei]KAG3143746.1 hypothetical protein PI126_g14475 [Phytophthora idaei]